MGLQAGWESERHSQRQTAKVCDTWGHAHPSPKDTLGSTCSPTAKPRFCSVPCCIQVCGLGGGVPARGIWCALSPSPWEMPPMLVSSAWPQPACSAVHQKPPAPTLPLPSLDQLACSQPCTPPVSELPPSLIITDARPRETLSFPQSPHLLVFLGLGFFCLFFLFFLSTASRPAASSSSRDGQALSAPAAKRFPLPALPWEGSGGCPGSTPLSLNPFPSEG